jgi:peptidylprolyl isomerase
MRRAALLLLLALFAVGCGGSGEADPVDTESASESLGQKPTVEVPAGEPPASLEVTVLVEGSGETVEPGDTVAMQYVGVAFDSGEEFDASWNRGEPFVFQVGAGQVIRGWDLGIGGDGADIAPMQVGERRMLVIPPDLAYGDAGAGGVIAPGATLVFVVDLVAIQG